MFFVKNKNVKGVIFDVDGTLLDSLSMFLKCLNYELEEKGFQPVSKDFLYQNLGMGVSLRDILRKIVSENGDKELIEEMANGIIRQFWEVDFQIDLFSGVEETFDLLSARSIKIGLATARDSGASYEWKRFNHIGLGKYIHAIVTSSEVKERKPAPDIIIQCANKMGVEPEHCIVVGDSVSDIIAARSAGAFPVAVCTGVDDRERLKKAGAEIIIEKVDGLMKLLDYEEL